MNSFSKKSRLILLVVLLLVTVIGGTVGSLHLLRWRGQANDGNESAAKNGATGSHTQASNQADSADAKGTQKETQLAAAHVALGPSGSGSKQEMDALAKSATRTKMAPPSVLDKLLALQGFLQDRKPNWKEQFAVCQADLDPDLYMDTEVMLPLLLGVRIADGILAMQAQDAEKLNECAGDIESMAKKLQVDEGSLGRAKAARTAANKGEWTRVFSELSRLQDGVLREIERDANRDRGALLMCGGWIQGMRFASRVIEANYSGPASNLLREPILISRLRENLGALPATSRNHQTVRDLNALLAKVQEIVNVGMDDSKPDGWISKASVSALAALGDAFVKQMLVKN